MTTEQIRKAQQCLRDSAFVCKKCEGETLPCSECRFGLDLLVVDELEKMIPKPTNVDGAWNYCPTCGASIPCSVFHKPNYCHNCGQRIQLPKGDE